jgi:putative peptidoglycan lipid II flippase
MFRPIAVQFSSRIFYPSAVNKLGELSGTLAVAIETVGTTLHGRSGECADCWFRDLLPSLWLESRPSEIVMPQAATSLRSVAVLTLLTLGQMGLQFALQLLLAKRFGTAADMDAFMAASTLPLVVSGLLAGALASAFVPVYVQTRDQSGESAAWSMAVQLVCWLSLLTLLLWRVSKLFAEPWMRALHPGFDDEQIARTAVLFQTLSSLMVWNSLSGLARAWNHCHGRFAVTGIAALLGNSVTFALAWRDGPNGGMDRIAQAVSIGAVITLALQMPWVSIFSRGWPVTKESQSAVQRCLVLMLPLMFGLACNQLDPLLDRALTSELSLGSVSQLGYAARLAAAVLTLSTSGLAVVAFPALARHAAERDDDKLRAEIAAALRFLTLLLVPIVGALIVFGEPLIRDLLQRGRFSAEDTRVVSSTLAMLCGMIVGGSLGEIAAKVFYSRQNTRTPVIVGLIGFGVGVALKLVWVRSHGVLGLAAATSAFYLLNATVLLGLIVGQLGLGIFRGVLGTLLRVAIGSAASVGVGVLIMQTSLAWPSLWGAAGGGIALLVVLLLLRDDVAWRAVRMILPARTQEPRS